MKTYSALPVTSFWASSMVFSVDVIGACRLCFAPPLRFCVHNNMLCSDTSAQRSLRTSPARALCVQQRIEQVFLPRFGNGQHFADILSGVGTCLMHSSSAKGAMPRQGLRGTVSLCQFHRAFRVWSLRLADLLPRFALLSNRNLRAMAVVMSSMLKEAICGRHSNSASRCPMRWQMWSRQRCRLASMRQKVKLSVMGRALMARDKAVENWLQAQVGTAYDALKADPSRAVSVAQVRDRLAAEHAKR